VFGGMGWILNDTNSTLLPIFILLISFATGIMLCALIYRFILKPLKKAQNTSSPSEDELIGIRATVTETIIPNGFGEIRYIVNGNSFTAPAKETKDGEIKAGKDVAICWIKEHVFYVVEIHDM
jgi:membrane protein implicated in regulation of membrane protease activity